MDEFGELDDFEHVSLNLDTSEVESTSSPSDNATGEEFLDVLLKSRGIDDSSKIKFESEDGGLEERDWNSLNNVEKLNIINSGSSNPESDLDDDEINLINHIRTNNMSPSEYINYVMQSGAAQYAQDAQPELLVYSVDQYTDDQLFVADLLSRMPNISDDEALEALEQAKFNESLYAKQIGAIRAEYMDREDEMNYQSALEEQQIAQAEYQQFSQGVALQIEDFTEFAGYDLNMDQDDMLQLYEFVTGTDGAGVNHFVKALSDPKILVRTAYLALNGKQMIEDIDSYYKNEIARVRMQSYNKGVEDGQNNTSGVVYRENKRLNSIWDLDDF